MEKIVFKNNYTISNTFDNREHFLTAVKAMTKFNNSINDTETRTVEDIIADYSNLDYDSISKSDHLRIGRAISYMYSKGCFPDLERGKDKGVTKTYKKR